uniref:Uncharacterized protein n=1 Tax=Meloidogyne enterolobii TaxID=390850 RepID=A0A6V7V1G4_MELEN|nr:unnamed protein product [Meloidogyne enterolobii]
MRFYFLKVRNYWICSDGNGKPNCKEFYKWGFMKCNGSLEFDGIAAFNWIRGKTFSHDRRIKYAEGKLEELDNRVTDLERKVEVIVSNYLN